jgi:hypothetical protein
MNYTDIKPDQTEEENILMCTISDEALENSSGYRRRNRRKNYVVLLPHRANHLPSPTTN